MVTETVTEIVPLGEVPPLGQVPRQMYAQVIREAAFGEPKDAFAIERIDVPACGRDECLVFVMAAGINYNGIWAASGGPVNVIALHRKQGDGGDFHIAGSDASGIVYKVGEDVQGVRVGDEVVLHGSWWDSRCPRVLAGVDPMFSPTYRIWGYETNYGGFAQFTRVKATQVMPKPAHLSWEEAAAYMANGGAAYRGLYGFAEHQVRADDVVLVWGGAGGLGSLVIQLARAAGALPIAVVSDASKADYCLSIGAKGVVDRTKFSHWGMLPHWADAPAYAAWAASVRGFGEAIWAAVGARRNPRLVFEHPGEATIPTSCYVCEAGGMVVICAGTTGYNATLDLRHHWMRQKRLQGTHFANGVQCSAFNDLVCQRKIDPCLSRTVSFAEIGMAHQLMHEQRHPHGNMAALVGAASTGLGRR